MIKECFPRVGIKFNTCTTHITPPSLIDVKKFIENLVFRGLSLGKSPSNAGAKNLHMNSKKSCK